MLEISNEWHKQIIRYVLTKFWKCGEISCAQSIHFCLHSHIWLWKFTKLTTLAIASGGCALKTLCLWDMLPNIVSLLEGYISTLQLHTYIIVGVAIIFNIIRILCLNNIRTCKHYIYIHLYIYIYIHLYIYIRI